MRALTLYPEFAWAIHALDKRVENRGWALPLNQWFALHAGKNIGGRASAEGREEGLISLQQMAERAGWTVAREHRQVVQTTRLWFKRKDHPRVLVVNVDEIPTSALTGAFRVLRIEPPHLGDLGGWRAPAQVGNVIEYRPLATIIPGVKGKQGLWTLEPEHARVIEALVPTPTPPTEG